MATRRYKTGIDRRQMALLCRQAWTTTFPKTTWYGRSVPMLTAAAWWHSAGLAAASVKGTGQPAYAPSDLLKLYLYGYLHRVRSSRRLERECQRNLEVIWLLGGLAPGYKTIADFRKRHAGALKATNRDFVMLCRSLGLYGGDCVAIDGSFVRGKASIRTAAQLADKAQRLEQDIAKYLAELEQADQQDDEPPREDAALKDKLARLRERQAQCQADLDRLAASGQTQVSRTDPDPRLLNKGQGTVAGYNVQIAVDSRQKLLVSCEATQDGNDQGQLAAMATKAKETLGVGG